MICLRARTDPSLRAVCMVALIRLSVQSSSMSVQSSSMSVQSSSMSVHSISMYK